MAKTSNVIELNGKKYNALTGALLRDPAEPATYATHVKPLTVQPRPQPGFGNSVDGMLGGLKPAQHVKIAKKAPSIHQVKQIAHHQQEHSKTLMRHAVKAPVIKLKTATKSSSPLQKTLPAKLEVKPKLSSDVVDASRNQRALAVGHSDMVRRFNNTATANAYNQPLQPTPVAAKIPPVTHHQSTQPQRNAPGLRRPATTAPIARPPIRQAKTDIFERALATATSHEQPHPKESGAKKLRRGARRRSKLLSFSAAAAVLVLLAGFIAYQNKANIELQLASSKAGFHVNTPQYNPGGFALGKLSYSPGAAALAFTNTKDNESYNLTQKQSNWDSQTLLDNYVATASDSYQGYQASGRTVYVYGNGNATWVNGGIWYQIHTSSNLTSDQLVKIAASM